MLGLRDVVVPAVSCSTLDAGSGDCNRQEAEPIQCAKGSIWLSMSPLCRFVYWTPAFMSLWSASRGAVEDTAL